MCMLVLFTVPEQPADVKALASGPTSVLVTWKPPLHRNGVLTKYILYMAEQQPGQQVGKMDRYFLNAFSACYVIMYESRKRMTF